MLSYSSKSQVFSKRVLYIKFILIKRVYRAVIVEGKVNSVIISV